MVRKDYYTYERMEFDIDALIKQIEEDKWKPELIVGILRGGIIPAVHLSHIFNTSLLAIEWSNRDDAVGKEIPEELYGAFFADCNILLVDDICDSGATLREIYDDLADAYLKAKFSAAIPEKNLRTAVLHYNEGQNLFRPNYYSLKIDKSKNNTWLVYPWEVE